MKLFEKIYTLISNYYGAAAKSCKNFRTKHPILSTIYNCYLALCAIGAIVGAIYLRIKHPRIAKWFSLKNQWKLRKEAKAEKIRIYTESLQQAIEEDAETSKEVLPEGTFDDTTLGEDELPQGVFIGGDPID